MIFIDFQGSADKKVSVVSAAAVGPTRRLVIQAWIHGLSLFSLIFRDLLDRVLKGIRPELWALLGD